MAQVSVKFAGGLIVNMDHAGYRYSRVDTVNNRIELSNDGTNWILLWPQPPPSCYSEEDDEYFHEFDDHPTICSACGESFDRAAEIDFMEDSD